MFPKAQIKRSFKSFDVFRRVSIFVLVSVTPPLKTDMALVYKLSLSSATSSSFSFVNTKPFNSIKPNAISFSLHFKSFPSSSSSSPFTEKHSLDRYQRDNWLYNVKQQEPTSCSISSDPESVRQNDIALQLPELKNLLQVLREKREEKCGNGKGEKCGPGNVCLVGTGPGDPELLTVKAMRVIENADLLLYDRLVSNDVLDLVGPNATLLYVGKTAGYHSRTQEEIHELPQSLAEVGANVVRLKGGDPLVFGRGGEEMDFLQRQGIQVKVIPGIMKRISSSNSFKTKRVCFSVSIEGGKYSSSRME